ncbi:type IV pilin protein [Pseudomonas sp. NPDC090202]|uniref:type IV pilin protein n=1 Tax=unclassified Pseudomonas TaxID=196821 RepID=UPI003826DC1F
MHLRLKRLRGFTLIELMVTVAIVAILAAVALPSYTRYVQRGYRSEGLAMLNDAVARMERFYAQNNSYAATNLAGIGITNANSASGRYTLSFTATPTATAYSLQVAPQGAQATDTCGTLSITQDGTRTSSTGAANCF